MSSEGRPSELMCGVTTEPLLDSGAGQAPSQQKPRWRLVSLLLSLPAALGAAFGYCYVRLGLIHAAAQLLILAPNLASCVGSCFIIDAWLRDPTCSPFHLRSHVSLAVATLWYSTLSVSYALTQSCVIFRLAAFGWIATWVWALPISIDWLLLILCTPTDDWKQKQLFRWCHFCWPVSLVVGLPYVLVHDSSAELIMRHGWPLPAHCDLGTTHGGWPYLLSGAFAAFALVILCTFAFGLRHSCDRLPLVVYRRQRRRAVPFVFAFLVMHPATLALHILEQFISPGAALLCTLTSASWQGSVFAFAHALESGAVLGGRRSTASAGDRRAVHFASGALGRQEDAKVESQRLQVAATVIPTL